MMFDSTSHESSTTIDLGMARLTAVFVAICMTVISGSLAVVARISMGFTLGESLAVAFALLLVMLITHYQITRFRDKAQLQFQMDELTRVKLAVAREFKSIQDRAVALDESVKQKVQDEVDPVLAEVEVLGTLVKQMAESLAGLEDRINVTDRVVTKLEMRPARIIQTVAPVVPPANKITPPDTRKPALPSSENAPGSNTRPASSKSARSKPANANPAATVPAPVEERDNITSSPNEAKQKSEHEQAPSTNQFHALGTPGYFDPDDIAFEESKPEITKQQIETASNALRAGRLELHLQPIVELPQRKVRFYEGFARLRDTEDQLLLPYEFLPALRQANLLPMLDKQMLVRIMQILQRFVARGRPIELFYNLAVESLSDSHFFSQFLTFIETRRELKDHLIFEFSEPSLEQFGSLENQTLTGLKERGFRFSLDGLTTTQHDYGILARRGFHFVKLDQSLLVQSSAPNSSDIHPEDFSSMVGRSGIEVIIDKIEKDSVVAEILDLNIQFAQGNLFAPPKQVRQDEIPSARTNVSNRPRNSQLDQPQPRPETGLAAIATQRLRRPL